MTIHLHSKVKSSSNTVCLQLSDYQQLNCWVSFACHRHNHLLYNWPILF